MIRLLLLLAVVGLSGCAAARVDVQDLPIQMQRSAHPSQEVPVFDRTLATPPRSGIPVAMIGAHGNGYASHEFLVKKLAEKGGEIGADYIILSSEKVNQGPTVTTFSYSTAVSETIHTLSLYAVACVNAPVRLGAKWADDYKVTDVIPDGPCAKAGMKIGDRLLAIDGERTSSGPLAPFRAIARLKPGQVARVEVIDSNNQQKTLDVTCAANN